MDALGGAWVSLERLWRREEGLLQGSEWRVMEPRPGTQIHLWERAAGAEEKRWDGKSDMRGGDQE